MIHCSIENRVALLTMDAAAKNAMSAADLHALKTILHSIEIEGKADGIVLTGANNAFCSGLAYNPSADKQTQLDSLFPALEEALQALRELSLPLVCVVNGHALGAGFLMMATADMLLLMDHEKIKYGLPEVMIDLHITPPMLAALRMRFTDGQIRRLLFGGYITAAELSRFGAIDGTFATTEDAISRAMAYIRALAPHLASVRKCKEIM